MVKFLKPAGVLVAAIVLLGASGNFSAGLAASGQTDTPGWVNPPAVALRKIHGVMEAQASPNFLSNLDCTLLTYRLTTASTMRSDCFSDSAFGLVDTASGYTIFNGTDEAVLLSSYNNQQVLIPWPGALNLVAADTAPTGGSYLRMYKNPVTAMQDQRNYAGQLVGKRLSVPPEAILRDRDGKQLLVNLQTISFSDNGSWLVAETRTGAFIRLNLATQEAIAFAPAFGQPGSPALLQSAVAVAGSGQFIAIANDLAESLKVYDSGSCSRGAVYDNCASREYWPELKRQLSGLYGIRQVRFVNEGLLRFEVLSKMPEQNGTYLFAPRQSIDHLVDYLALGDSYTSGEGAYNYRTGTDTPDNICHTSGNAYPALLTRSYFSAKGGHSVACSGAVISDVDSTSGSYRGQVKDAVTYDELRINNQPLLAAVHINFIPGYIAQHRFVQQNIPRIISVSAGGNDIGFGDIIQVCVVPNLSIHRSNNDCFNTYEDRLELLDQIDRTSQRWTALFKQLARQSPLGQVYAIGYPDIVSDTGSCALNVQLSQSERAFARQLVAYLNTAIHSSADKAKVTYIDITNALAGHRLCEASGFAVAVNGITAGRDAGLFGIEVLGKESYHPNMLGHQLIAQEILKQSRNFTSGAMPAQAPDTGNFLNKPKTNRPIRERSSAQLTKRKLQKGSRSAVKVNGPRHGLKPGIPYKIIIGGEQPAGTIVSSPDGSLDGEVTIPIEIPGGGNVIDIIGDNQAGQPIVITQPIYIDEGPADSDGDGVPNAIDSCPTFKSSNADEDKDGIDDICDGHINDQADSTPPAMPPPSGGTHPGRNVGIPVSIPAPVPVASINRPAAVNPPPDASMNTSAVTVAATFPPRNIRAVTTLSGQAVSSPQAAVVPGSSPTALRAGRHPATKNAPVAHQKLASIPWIRFFIFGIIVWWILLILVWLLKRWRQAAGRRISWRYANS